MRTDDIPGAGAFLPTRKSLSVLRDAIQTCRGCTLYQHATQAVFGEGASTSRVMLIGEVPGDKEDLAGKPFVGPSGLLRAPDDKARRTAHEEFLHDFELVGDYFKKLARAA